MPRLYSVGRWADSPAIEVEILKSDEVRRETLKRCYQMKGYARLSREEKNRIYDAIREEVKSEIR